jgi:hypothetical protein
MSQPNITSPLETQGILKYIARTICADGPHAQTNQNACSKHTDQYYWCRICQLNARPGSFYVCANCKKQYCIKHFLRHLLLLEHCQNKGARYDCKLHYLKVSKNILKFGPIKLFHRIANNLGPSNLRIKVNASILKEKDFFPQLFKAKHLKQLSKALIRYRSIISRREGFTCVLGESYKIKLHAYLIGYWHHQF